MKLVSELTWIEDGQSATLNYLSKKASKLVVKRLALLEQGKEAILSEGLLDRHGYPLTACSSKYIDT